MKKLLAIMLVLVLAFGLVACGGGDQTDGGDVAEDAVTVCIVVADGFGDKSFYDSSKEGLDKLVADYGVNAKTIECNGENFEQQMMNAAEEADIVVPVGWQFYDIETVAPQYPETTFIWVDNETSTTVENILCITYAQNEGSFLAGYIAAKMSTSGVVGAVGGMDNATINDFIIGYEQGAKFANPDCKVLHRYIGNFDDPAGGKECALALNGEGADVIFQIAGNAGNGVFEAAAENGFYAIGVDSDQKYVNDEVIICSMMKEVGNSIYDAVVQYINGELEANRTWVADMATGYVKVSYGEEGSIQQVSDEIKAEVEELAQQIVNGDIVVETTR